MSRFRAVPLVPIVATLFAGCSASSSSPVLNGPPVGPSSIADVVTYHYDNQRTGENLKETTLTTSNVNLASFGKVGEFTVDGQIDGQVLFLSQLAIPGQGNKDVLYIATENDTVYAVDAQSISGSFATILWKTSVLPSGESPATTLPCGNISPNGITATPVIDRARNAIYVEGMSQEFLGKHLSSSACTRPDQWQGTVWRPDDHNRELPRNGRQQQRRHSHFPSPGSP